jgi:hypothetical protein
MASDSLGRVGRYELERRVRQAESATGRGRSGLPGWDCASCGAFNGDVKEKLQKCRCCDASRPKTRLETARACVAVLKPDELREYYHDLCRRIASENPDDFEHRKVLRATVGYQSKKWILILACGHRSVIKKSENVPTEVVCQACRKIKDGRRLARPMVREE